MQPAASNFNFAKVKALSARERQVFESMGEGHSANEIAQRMGLRAKTVETYRARIKDTFDIAGGGNRTLALAWDMFHRSQEPRQESPAGIS